MTPGWRGLAIRRNAHSAVKTLGMRSRVIDNSDDVTGRPYPKVPRFDALFGRCGLPLAERVEAVPNPDIIGDCGNQSDFLNEVFVGKCVETLVVRILRALEAFSDRKSTRLNSSH